MLLVRHVGCQRGTETAREVYLPSLEIPIVATLLPCQQSAQGVQRYRYMPRKGAAEQQSGTSLAQKLHLSKLHSLLCKPLAVCAKCSATAQTARMRQITHLRHSTRRHLESQTLALRVATEFSSPKIPDRFHALTGERGPQTT